MSVAREKVDKAEGEEGGGAGEGGGVGVGIGNVGRGAVKRRPCGEGVGRGFGRGFGRSESSL